MGDSQSHQEIMNDELNALITCKEMKNTLKKLKNGKSAGLHLICNEFLKFGSNTLTLHIVKLFTKILLTEHFPVDWNISFLSVIHNSGSLYDCNNRRISISSCLGRHFTKILQA